MEANRVLRAQKKSKLILNSSFPVTKELNVEDTGQMLITGFVENERLEEFFDGEELLIKTIRIDTAELIKNRDIKI